MLDLMVVDIIQLLLYLIHIPVKILLLVKLLLNKFLMNGWLQKVIKKIFYHLTINKWGFFFMKPLHKDIDTIGVSYLLVKSKLMFTFFIFINLLIIQTNI